MKFLLLMFCVLALKPMFASASEEFVVAIDVGHTKKNVGAISARGVAEYEFNQAMATAIINRMQGEKNIRAFIVEANNGEISLAERTEVASQNNADLFISIHHDSVQDKYLKFWDYKSKKNHYSDEFDGYSIFVSQKNIHSNKSIAFAKMLGGQLRGGGFTPTLHHAEKVEGESRELLDESLGVYLFDDLVVLKTANMPAILLECGVIVNRKEELLVSGEKFRSEFADLIIESILEYSRAKW